VLNNATEEQQAAIDRGEANISGTFQSANQSHRHAGGAFFFVAIWLEKFRNSWPKK
jgi:hypothetical protein